MRTAIPVVLRALIGLAGCDGSSGDSGGGLSIDERTRRFAIASSADCDAIRDYPYARNLFCPAAFAAAQAMRSAIAERLGADQPAGGFFYVYQTGPGLAAPSSTARMK